MRMSDRDFLELVAFAAKVDNEGYDYAYSEYRPRFEAPDLQAVACDREQLETLLDGHEGAITRFWEEPDAMDRYDAHIDSDR